MHGRSRMIIYPRTPLYNTGTGHVGFPPTRQALLAPSAKRREVFGESREGQLRPARNRSCGGLSCSFYG